MLINVNTTIIDVEKPRDVLKINNSQVPFEFGTKFKLNNVHGTPQIGAATLSQLDYMIREEQVR